MDWQAVWLTLRLACCATAILFVLGLPLAYWLANTRWRFKFLIESVVALPLVLPPTVVGFYLLMATGPLSPLGQAYERTTGGRIPFSFTGLLLGLVICNIPFAVRPFIAAFAGMNRRLVEAAWCLGESRWQTFRRVTLPLCWPGVLAGLVLTFAHSIGEFGVVLMIGGNIEGQTRTISTSIYENVQSQEYDQAMRTSLALVAFSLVVLSVTHLLTSRTTGRRTSQRRSAAP